MLIKRKTCRAKENHEKTLEKHRAQMGEWARPVYIILYKPNIILYSSQYQKASSFFFFMFYKEVL